MTPFPIVAALLCLSCAPAGAAEIDKSGGEVQVPYAGAVGPGPPAAQDPLNEEALRARDSGVQRANAQVDQAERALAVARRTVWSVRAAGHLAVPRMARADSERIDFYKKEVAAAQRVLLDVLMHKRRAAARGELTASYQPPLARP